MLKITIQFLSGCILAAIGFDTGWWLLILAGIIPMLSATTLFFEGITAAIQAMKE